MPRGRRTPAALAQGQAAERDHGRQTLIFSAAHPLQGGRLHVNEQPAGHWIARLRTRHFQLTADDDRFRQKIQELDLPPWYAHNVHLFERVVN